MECYEGATMIKTFRGLIANGTQDTIVLHTNDGSTGYRVVKFQVIGREPGEEHLESTVKIYKVEQTTIDNTIDFSDQTLLGAIYYQDKHDITYVSSVDVIFDQDIFNQDIFITYLETDGSAAPINYYLELEQMKLDLSKSTVATLKDIRNEHRIPPG